MIDIGINYKTLCNALESEGITPKDLYGVLITHIHTDHIKGLASFVKKDEHESVRPRTHCKRFTKSCTE